MTGRASRRAIAATLDRGAIVVFEEALQTQSWYSPAYTPESMRRDFAAPLRAFLLRTLAYGTYPEVVTTDTPEALLRELGAHHLWKDILHAGLVKTPELIKRLLMLLAHQVSAELSVHELATQLHMARPTVERYLDLLEQTYVIFRLPAFSTNPRKEIAKSKKIYFWDTGIRNALLQAFSRDESRPDIGALWENWVIAEAAKRNLLAGEGRELFFWRSRAQSEVDLVVKTGAVLAAFQIKWRGKRPASRAFENMYGVAVGLLDASDPFAGATVLA